MGTLLISSNICKLVRGKTRLFLLRSAVCKIFNKTQRRTSHLFCSNSSSGLSLQFCHLSQWVLLNVHFVQLFCSLGSHSLRWANLWPL